MTETNEETKRSLVDLFNKKELKSLFLHYLVIICCLEVFIFFVAFFSMLEPYPTPFPWRKYFFAAFTIPITITFMLGIIIIAFNTYYFSDTRPLDSIKSYLNENGSEPAPKSRIFLNLSWQFQFIFFLLIIMICSLLLYHLNDILVVFSNAGEKALNILTIVLGIILTGGVILSIAFLYFHYKLRKKRMEYAHKYKWEMLERTGMLLLDDNTVINSEGKVIKHAPEPNEGARQINAITSENFSLLSPNAGKKKSE